MKTVTILSLLLLLASPVFGELTKEDLRTIIKEENAASEKRMREYIDLKIETVNARIDALDKSLNTRIDATNTRIDATNARIDALEKSLNTRIDALEKNVDDKFDAVDKKLNWVWGLLIALIALITAAIAAPQIIVAFKEKGQNDMQTELQQLRERLAALENPPS